MTSLAPGDRVVNLQLPGPFTVVRVEGDMVTIETPDGLRMVVRDTALRKLGDT